MSYSLVIVFNDFKYVQSNRKIYILRHTAIFFTLAARWTDSVSEGYEEPLDCDGFSPILQGNESWLQS